MAKIPAYESLMNPLLRALRLLGGSGSIEEIYEKVIELEKFPDDLIGQLHDPEKSTQTEVAYRLAWARTHLKKCGLLENSGRGIWALTAKAQEIESVDPGEVVRTSRSMDKAQGPRKTARKEKQAESQSDEAPDEQQSWKEELHRILTKEMDAATFERLSQRLLRESGFISVEVTGRTGDGGIDGKGIARIHGLMSFHVFFQCKKYQGSVSAGDVRDFRGAMVGRADKGLFITTGTFTPSAVKEATRDGAPPIDLIDGDALAEKLKELGLGVRCEMVENVVVDSEWFKSL